MSIEIDSGIYHPKPFREFMELYPEYSKLSLEERMKKYRTYGINRHTSFFRDELVLAAFKHLVLPSYPKDIEIASIGCATGQELYSLMLRNWADKDRIRVDGYDINPQNLRIARKGEYTIFRTSGLDGSRKIEELKESPDETFTTNQVDSHHMKIRFSDMMKERLQFFRHDIMEGPLPRKYDTVFLLNVLMHYQREGRETILKNVHDSMKDGGWLLCERSAFIIQTDEYLNWMKDITALGFQKQEFDIPAYLGDQTDISKIYKKL